VRQSDRSSRDAISDTNEETEQKDTENDGDTWDEEAEVDDELQLNKAGGSQTTIDVRDEQEEATRIPHKRQGIKCVSQTTLRTKDDTTTIASPVLSKAETGDSETVPAPTGRDQLAARRTPDKKWRIRPTVECIK